MFDDHDLAQIHDHLGYDPVVARRQAMNLSEAEFDDVADRVRATGIPFTSELLEGDVLREVAGAASRANARFIAVGTHGRNAFGRFVIGSVAERLLCEAPVPVMTVRV